MGNLASIGSQTQELESPLFPGRLMAKSTILEPASNFTFLSYCPGARNCFKSNSSYSSPDMPRRTGDFRIFLTSPTSETKCCIVPAVSCTSFRRLSTLVLYNYSFLWICHPLYGTRRALFSSCRKKRTPSIKWSFSVSWSARVNFFIPSCS